MILFFKSLILVVIFPLVGSLLIEPLLGFMDAVHGCRYKLHTAAFLAKLLFRRKEEFCRKYTSSCRIKWDGRPLHLIKTNR